MRSIKQIILTSLAIIAAYGCSQAQKPYTYSISGTIPGASKILLSADVFGGELLDSSSNANGQFFFQGTAKSVSMGTLIVEKKDARFSDYHSIFIEPGSLKVTLLPGGRKAIVRAGRNNDIAAEVELAHQVFWQKVPPMYDTLNFASMSLSGLHAAEVVNIDSVSYYQEVTRKMEEASMPYIEARNHSLMDAFKKNPSSYFTAYYAMNSFQLPADTLKNMYARFDDPLKESAIGKEWHKQLFEKTVLQAGDAAVAFSAKTLDGKSIKLSDYRGKYVLLGFWATWCMPCRAGNPHLIELYKKYKDKGIEFIGVADDDQNIDGWKKAVQNDGIGIWPQILRGRDTKDENGESNDLSGKYTVGAYPTKILIDLNGMIIGRYGDGGEGEETLDEKLATIFAN